MTFLLLIKKTKGSIVLTKTCYLKFNVSCIKCNKREDVIEKERNMREIRWGWKEGRKKMVFWEVKNKNGILDSLYLRKKIVSWFSKGEKSWFCLDVYPLFYSISWPISKSNMIQFELSCWVIYLFFWQIKHTFHVYDLFPLWGTIIFVTWSLHLF